MMKQGISRMAFIHNFRQDVSDILLSLSHRALTDICNSLAQGFQELETNSGYESAINSNLHIHHSFGAIEFHPASIHVRAYTPSY